MATSAPLALAGEHLALIERGVSTIVGSASLDLVPSLMRAVGSAVHEGGASLTVYLARSQASQLLRDIAATGRMAVVFSQPSTHRTLQVKTRQVRLREATEADVPVIYGNMVLIDHGQGIASLYSHLSSIETTVGTLVDKNQPIARSGATGMAGGDHLHFSMLVHGIFVTPTEWWDQHWIDVNIKSALNAK